MKKGFDIEKAEESIGGHFRALRSGVMDPGTVRIDEEKTVKTKEASGSRLPLQLAGAFLAAVIVGGGTFTALKLLERHGGAAGPGTEAAESLSTVPDSDPAVIKGDGSAPAVLINLPLFTPYEGSETRLEIYMTKTVFQNDELTLAVGEGGSRCFIWTDGGNTELSFEYQPVNVENAVWVNELSGIERMLLYVDGDAVYAVNAQKQEKVFELESGLAAVTHHMFLDYDGEKILLNYSGKEKEDAKSSWDVYKTYVLSRNPATGWVCLDIENYNLVRSYMEFTAYGQTVCPPRCGLWTSIRYENGEWLEGDGAGAMWATGIPVIRGRHGESPEISWKFKDAGLEYVSVRAKLSLEGEPVAGTDSEIAEYLMNTSERRVYIIYTAKKQIEISDNGVMGTEENGFEFPVIIEFEQTDTAEVSDDIPPYDEQVVIETAGGKLRFTRISGVPEFTVTLGEGMPYPVYLNDAVMQMLFETMDGKPAAEDAWKLTADCVIVMSFGDAPRYIFGLCYNGCVSVSKADGGIVGCVELTPEEVANIIGAATAIT